MWFQPSRNKPKTRAVARRLVIMSSRQIAFGPIPLLPHHARFGFAAYTRREATPNRRFDGAGVSGITGGRVRPPRPPYSLGLSATRWKADAAGPPSTRRRIP